MRTDRVGRAAAISTAVVLAFGVGACTQSAPRAAGEKGSQASKDLTSPSPSLAGEAASEAVAAYRAMWADAEEASLTAHPQHPRLDDHAEKSALWLLQYVMTEARKTGVTLEGTVVAEPTVVKSGQDKVELRDCIDGSKWVQVKPGGSSDGLSGGRRRAEATVVRTSGDKWKVSDLYWEDVGTCTK